MIPEKDGKLLDGKRRARRIEIQDEFLVEFYSAHKTQPLVGYGRDLSSIGIRFLTQARVKKNRRLTLKIYFSGKFPGPKQLEAPALVVRCYQPKGSRFYRIACVFYDLDFHAREALQQFLFWAETR